jgi:3-phytase
VRRSGTLAALLIITALVVTGCGSSQDGTGKRASDTRTDSSGVVEVPADAETRPTQHSGDSADDPAIWVSSEDPAQSLVIGNDKQGALETYNLDGALVQRIEASTKFWGNVDIRYDVSLATGPADVVAVANSGVRLYVVDPASRKLAPITADGAPLDTGGGEGVCLYASPDGELSVFMVFISGGVRQFALRGDGSGQLSLELARSFRVGSEAEGCVVDDESQALYIAEENKGLWKYDADPAGGETRVLVDALKPDGHQIADIEGVTMVDDGGGRGLIFTSSQGQGDEASYFSTFDRESGSYRSSFRIVDGKAADGCSHTDGITATASPLGPEFPEGAFVCQDDSNTTPGDAGNQDFKLTRLEKVRP